MEKTDWQRWAAFIFCAAVAVAAVWFAIKYLLGIFLPFLIAWGVALAVTPCGRWISKKTKIPKKFCCAVLLVLALGIIITVISLAANRLIYELRRLLDWLMTDEGGIAQWIENLFGTFDGMAERIPLLGSLRGIEELSSLWESFDELIIGLVSNIISKLSAALPAAAFGIIGKLPSFLLMLTVTIIACFYFCLDLDSVHAALTAFFPAASTGRLPMLKGRVFGALLKWLRAYALLFGLTFAELFVGFLILGVDYALLLALIGALVDILPVLGTGTILVPWGLYEIITKDFKTGFGLLILYAAITVIRQAAEPRIVGGSLGIHPLLTLVAMYCGFRLFGVAGMLLLPAALMLVKSISAPVDGAEKNEK